MTMTDREQAVTELKALVQVPGALRIITNEHACGAGKHPDIPPFDAAVCDAFPYPLTDPRHFVIHAVVRLEGSNSKGQYTAHSAEGDYCQGQPEALLTRLREWRP